KSAAISSLAFCWTPPRGSINESPGSRRRSDRHSRLSAGAKPQNPAVVTWRARQSQSSQHLQNSNRTCVVSSLNGRSPRSLCFSLLHDDVNGPPRGAERISKFDVAKRLTSVQLCPV